MLGNGYIAISRLDAIIDSLERTLDTVKKERETRFFYESYTNVYLNSLTRKVLAANQLEDSLRSKF